MACASPKPAWQFYRGGRPTFVPPPARSAELYTYLDVPCGQCIGCRVRTARDWSIRCQLELLEHDAACWVTLTYSDEHLPATLHKPDLSGYLKRLRARVAPTPVKFFAVGEYGGDNGRPHFHSILFGLHQSNRHVEDAWPYGFARADPLSPRAIAYVAGYAQKKINADPILPRTVEAVDQDTGEVLAVPFQPPFRLMSRGGRKGAGIGGSARRHRNSWRTTAINNGAEVPVPRYLHAAWKEDATSIDLDNLANERAQRFVRQSFERREAGEKIARAQYNLQTERRSLR